MQRKDYFNIPNLMGYFRILMIPVFMVLYLQAETDFEYFLALLALCFSMITDLFDGKIARKYNMVTPFGKVLDPVADKLTQLAIAAALAVHYPVMRWFIVIFICKELYMSVMGLYLLRKKLLYGARWYGKAATTIIDVGCVALLLFRQLPQSAAWLVIGIMTAFTLFSLLMYMLFHLSVLKGRH